ncbi:hypothetical protein B0H21DRAFT_199744 [Amylocystis lapponica]|nr:hypothetical protein B0H21DRAFT_199744 [Amylocystis lapponica]
MADMDVFAAMGIAGFGKKQNQRLLDPKRFEKNRREDAIHTPHPPSKDDVSAAPTSSSSAHPEAPKSVQQEPEYDPDEMGPHRRSRRMTLTRASRNLTHPTTTKSTNPNFLLLTS